MISLELAKAGVGAVDALGLEGDGLGKLRGGGGLRGGDLLGGDLDAHLVVLAAGLGASVLLVGAATVAAAVVHDEDHGGTAGLVHLGLSGVGAEEGGSHGGGGTGLDDLAAASLHGHHGGEGGGGAGEGEDDSGAADHCAMVKVRGTDLLFFYRRLWPIFFVTVLQVWCTGVRYLCGMPFGQIYRLLQNQRGHYDVFEKIFFRMSEKRVIFWFVGTAGLILMEKP